MAFRPEPEYRHGSSARVGVLYVNLGTPAEPTAPALRRYLAQFLSDPRVVEIPKLAWWPILHGIILRTRPAKSAAKYASVWTKDGSPLLVWTVKQAKLLQGALGERGLPVVVRPAMRYGEPSVARGLDDLRAEGCTRILVLPAYPQYAAATTASAIDAVGDWAQGARHVPELRVVNRYHDHPGYIGALAESVRAHWKANGRGGMLVMSFHGVPERSLKLGDPYHCECLKTARLLAERLGLAADGWRVTFQSRFGKAKWLEPYTEPTVQKLAREGCARVDVICPGFTADCLETLEEIGQEVREAFISAGGREFHYVPCLNDSTPWVHALADIAEQHLQGWPLQPADAATDAAERERQRQRALTLGATR